MGNLQGNSISLSVMSYRKMILDGFFNLTEPNFLVSPHREIPSEKLFMSVNRQAIVISLSFYPCRELPVGLPSELIFLTVLPYIPDGFRHTGKFRFLVVSDPFFLLWFAGYAFGVTRE